MGAVKGNVLRQRVAAGVQPRGGGKFQQRAVGGVAADGAPAGQQTFRIECTGELQQLPQLPLAADRHRMGMLLTVAGDQRADLQLAFGQCTGFVGEQNVEAAGGFDADQLAHQHMILQHPPHIGGQHHGDHHWQPLRHRHHHHGDGERDRVQQMADHGGGIGKGGGDAGGVKGVVQQKGMEQVCHRHQRRGDVPQPTKRFGQPRQPHPQGAFARILLHFARHAAVKGAVADLAHLHHSLTAAHHATAEQTVGSSQIGGVGGIGTGRFDRFVAFAVEGGLIHRQPSVQQNAVGGHPLAGLQQHHIVHHDLGDGQRYHLPVAAHPAGDACGVLLQLFKRRFAAVFG